MEETEHANKTSIGKVGKASTIKSPTGKKSKDKKMQNKNSAIKEFVGNLKDFDENYIMLELENGEVLQVDRKNISQIKTVFDWDSLD